MEKNEKLLSPCGLYCGVCGIYYATRDNNQKFMDKLLFISLRWMNPTEADQLA